MPTGRLGVTVALSELKQRLAAEQPKVSVCFGIGVHKEPVLNAKEDSTLNNMSVLPSELADLRYVKAHVELKAVITSYSIHYTKLYDLRWRSQSFRYCISSKKT